MIHERKGKLCSDRFHSYGTRVKLHQQLYPLSQGHLSLVLTPPLQKYPHSIFPPSRRRTTVEAQLSVSVWNEFTVGNWIYTVLLEKYTSSLQNTELQRISDFVSMNIDGKLKMFVFLMRTFPSNLHRFWTVAQFDLPATCGGTLNMKCQCQKNKADMYGSRNECTRTLEETSKTPALCSNFLVKCNHH